MKNQNVEIIDLLSDDDDDEVKVLQGGAIRAASSTQTSAAAMKTTGYRGTNHDNTVPHEYQNLSIVEIKRQLTQRGIPIPDFIEKMDLIRRLMAGNSQNVQARTGTSSVQSNQIISEVKSQHATAKEQRNSVSARDPYGPLADGETTTVPGSKAGRSYKIKSCGEVYHCTCPAWKFQKTNKGRTCKHIDSLRVGYAPNHVGAAVSATAAKRKASSTAGGTSGTTKKAAQTRHPAANNITDKQNFQVTLAETWNPEKHDPTGYYLSEKLDGQRCYWDGTALWSRAGNRLDTAPAWFTNDLPTDMWLDGELFLGRGRFQELQSCKASATDPRWRRVQLVVFDAPQVPGPFRTRLEALRQGLVGCSVARVLDQSVCTGRSHVETKLQAVLRLGGEGVMLRHPQALYEHKRTNNLLKVKQWHDAEAVVIDHVRGKGKHQGRMGALQCQMTSGESKMFKLGTGFSDTDREHPPAIGSVITYKYQELTNGGVPRFPVFLRVREQE